MRVHSGFAMSWKMLRAGYNSLFPQAVCGGTCELADKLGVITRAANPNHRVQWFGVNVTDGSVVHVDSKVVQTFAGGSPHLIGEVGRMGSSQGHWSGELSGDWGTYPCNQPILLINPYKKRMFMASNPGLILQSEYQRLEGRISATSTMPIYRRG